MIEQYPMYHENIMNPMYNLSKHKNSSCTSQIYISQNGIAIIIYVCTIKLAKFGWKWCVAINLWQLKMPPCPMTDRRNEE